MPTKGRSSRVSVDADRGCAGLLRIAVFGAAAGGLIGLIARRRPALAPAGASSQRFERGFDDAAIGMMILTPKLRVLRVNDALCRAARREAPKSSSGDSILEFTHPDDVERSVD